eukprot:CAMPEP_0195305134 /NCGR_PEP_ID=MMETSP0707-20130614/35750_1 /TAXON_ID=33640 /ORGANISM="Asterionellopsis glacialis, Strain CCMP134" /LENGTH=136 /DNA_ID=CAMNT_0040369167 /DNA_START=44 /DNA_END=451 /DNA_ORIENTATION=+
MTDEEIQSRDASPSEKHGFVLHVMCFPLAATYLIWTFVPDEVLHSLHITYYAPKEWAILAPTYMLCIFLAIPLLYAAVNILATPKIDSPLTIGGDSFSRGPPSVSTGSESILYPETNGSSVPEIYDIDVNIINRLV